MRNIRVSLVLLGSLLLVSCAEPRPKKNVNEAGKKVYLLNCVVCHGKDGKKGLGGAKDLTQIESNKALQREIILNGKGAMTPFKGRLSEEQIEAVIEYVAGMKE